MRPKYWIFVLIVFTFTYIGTHLKEINNYTHGLTIHIKDQDSSIIAEAATVVDLDSGEVLYSKNENEQLYPASTTKIMTALLALKYGNLNETITVGKEVHLKTAGESTAWLQQGQTLTLRELLAGLMLPSGNDAARTIGIYIGKKQIGQPQASNQQAIDRFVGMMNKKAKDLGAVNTHFMNPHGLHDPNHYSTAHDLALIAKAAMSNPRFEEIVAEPKFSDNTVTYQNTNKLIDASSGFYFEGANGIKTGFTEEAGYCLVSSAEQSGRKLIAVVLNSTKSNVWVDSISLLKNGFSLEYAKK
jgi:serine-type D-Ala-D-Ala carboxypeptidase (penicillin-binding protein 5/6)